MFNSNLGYYGEYCDSCGCPNNMYCIGGRNITAGNLNCVCNDGYDITSSCTKCLPGYGGSKCTKCPVCDTSGGACSEGITGTDNVYVIQDLMDIYVIVVYLDMVDQIVINVLHV